MSEFLQTARFGGGALAACYYPAVAGLRFSKPIEKEEAMPWYIYLAYFFGGAFLVNAVPHFVNGVSGRSFPSPFASPPGKGLSSPTVNVLWGTLNAVIGYILVWHVGAFHGRHIPDAAITGVGGLLMAVMLSRTFGRPTARE